MTPEEIKARELTNRFAKVEPYLPTKETVLFMYEAKQCAVICVDEMLSNIDATILHHKDSKLLPINKKYWLNVKEAITRL